MKHTNAKRIVLAILFCLLILLEIVGIFSGVMSIIADFEQALITKAVLHILMLIVIVVMYTRVILLTWNKMQQKRQSQDENTESARKN